MGRAPKGWDARVPCWYGDRRCWLCRLEICPAMVGDEAAATFGWRLQATSSSRTNEGEPILIISPRQAALIDGGDAGKGKVFLDALKRYMCSSSTILSPHILIRITWVVSMRFSKLLRSST